MCICIKALRRPGGGTKRKSFLFNNPAARNDIEDLVMYHDESNPPDTFGYSPPPPASSSAGGLRTQAKDSGCLIA